MKAKNETISIAKILKIECFIKENNEYSNRELSDLFDISPSTIKRIKNKREGKYRLIPMLLDEIFDGSCSDIEDYSDIEIEKEIEKVLKEKNIITNNKRIFYKAPKTSKTPKATVNKNLSSDDLNNTKFNFIDILSLDDFKFDNENIPNRYKKEFSLLQYLLFIKVKPDFLKLSFLQQEKIVKISRTTLANINNRPVSNHKIFMSLINDKPELIEFYKNEKYQDILNYFNWYYILKDKNPRSIIYNQYYVYYYSIGYKKGIFQYPLDKIKKNHSESEKQRKSRYKRKLIDLENDEPIRKKFEVRKNILIMASYRSSDTIKKLAEYFDCKIYEKPRYKVDLAIPNIGSVI